MLPNVDVAAITSQFSRRGDTNTKTAAVHSSATDRPSTHYANLPKHALDRGRQFRSTRVASASPTSITRACLEHEVKVKYELRANNAETELATVELTPVCS